jgi:hypothetical protein
MDAFRIAQVAARQLEDHRLLVAELLLAAEALAVDPEQNQMGGELAGLTL